MNTTIKLCTAYSKNEAQVLLLNNVKQLPVQLFSKDEYAYILTEMNEDKKSLMINQFKRIIFIHVFPQTTNQNLFLEKCRKEGDRLLTSLNRHKIKQLVLVDLTGNKEGVLAIAEGMALGNYQFLKYKKENKKEKHALHSILIHSQKMKLRDVELLQIRTDATLRCRDLVNEPQSHQSATQLAEEFRQLGKDSGFKTEVLKKSKIKLLKMGGLLAVNKGSQEPPTFTVMEWKPRNAKNKKPYVLVGKGVVYDTGGLSLKPTPNSMDFMKSDMAGAAVVGCAMFAIAKARLPVHVVGLVPATDNRLSENAYAPGDVVTMMSGQTVEVLNTDAEGRMILADALCFAKKYKPVLVMDFATLTGSAAAAVGPFGIVCMGNANEKTKNKLKECGDHVHERLAEFPFWDEYDELLNSDIADMKNIGGPTAGAITAGKFLYRFVGTDYSWMHFDIAGPAFLHAQSSYRGKNGSGIGVRLLFDFFAGF